MEEQHAVPQDITGFKFKLVGDMTVKQFAELAFGAVVAYLFYISPWHPLLKWPLVVLFGLLGFALAFVPIEERPLDVWIINFLRAIYRPTYYVWRKAPKGISLTAPQHAQFSPFFTKAPIPQAPTLSGQAPTQPAAALWPYTPPAVPSQPATPPVKAPEEKAPPAKEPEKPSQAGKAMSVEELLKLRAGKGAEPPSAPPAASEDQTVTIDKLVEKRREMAAQNETTAQDQLTNSEKGVNELTEENKGLLLKIEEVKGKITSHGGDEKALSAELAGLLERKAKLTREMAVLRDQLRADRVAPLTSSSYQEPILKKAPQVRVVSQPVPQPKPISLTEIPNVINGLVSDPKGNPLEGVIIIIKDKDGNSIRALKTNKVGQFIVSTPLPVGNYYLEMEKKDYDFDALEITLSGEVLAPLTIKGKEGAAEAAAAT